MSSRKYAQAANRRRKKTDANEKEIVDALEAAGCVVVPIGKPVDLLVGRLGVTHLLEVKNPDGKNRLEPAQRDFIAEWNGRPVVVVRTIDEALRAVGAASGQIQVARLPA